MNHVNITIINDCRDANAVGRQFVRASALMGGHVSFVGVSNDLEAAGNLIDVLDAYGEEPGVVLVNVAPRGGKAKRFANGTPFCYFRYKQVLVVSSFDGLTLSLVKKLRLTDTVHVLDIPTIVQLFEKDGFVSAEQGAYIVGTQFRSYEFLPRVGAYLLTHADVPADHVGIEEIPDAPLAVWWVDNFGNCKTTLLESDIPHTKTVTIKNAQLTYYDRLKDVPDTSTALITGSSGIADTRFLEIVVQGGNAAESLNVHSGASVL